MRLALVTLTAATVSSLGCLWSTTLPAGRSDLAASYLAFEQAFAAAKPTADRMADLNRRFDLATIAFFTGQFSRAIAELDGLTQSLAARKPSVEGRIAAALKLEFDPPVGLAGRRDDVRVAIGSLYPVEADPQTRVMFTLRLRGADVSGPPLSATFPVTPSILTNVSEDVRLKMPDSGLAAGPYSVQVETADGAIIGRGQWFAVPRSLDELRSENARRLAQLDAGNAARRQAVAICAARNRLLTDTPSPERSAEFLGDPLALAAGVESEIAALEEGRLPYKGRAGEYYRVVPGATETALRCFAPTRAAAEPERPLPLIVAFHGAGGDEQMFMEAYGAGLLRRIAAERGFLLVTPDTTAYLRGPASFDALLDSLRHDYPIDEKRVYVLGHSLGAVAASLLAAQRADVIAAAGCIAGGTGFARADRLSPTLVIVGELDPISPPARLVPEAERAAQAGKRVQIRRVKDYGHTLLVGATLPELIDWLQQHTRGE